MRALAGRLGTSAMAPYGYFGSREEIIAEVGARLMALVDTASVPGEPWDDTVRRTTASIRDVFRAHPNVAEVIASSATWDTALREHTRKIVGLHLDQGIPEAVLEQAWGIIDAFLAGFTKNEISMATFQQPPATDEGERWLAASRRAYTDESFHNGIEIIIAGIRSIAAPDTCEWRTPE